jgi:serine/threonine protein kinase
MNMTEFTSITPIEILNKNDNGVVLLCKKGDIEVVLKTPFESSNELSLLKLFGKSRGFMTPLKFGLFNGKKSVLFEKAEFDLLSFCQNGQKVKPQCFLSIAESLDQLHMDGFLHRDIHPGNIFYIDDRWVLGDFGISMKTGLKSNSHGVARYASPDQLMGKPGKNKDDLYSFALTLLFATKGVVPWESITEPALYLAKAKNPLPPVIGNSIPPMFERVLDIDSPLGCASFLNYYISKI